MSETKPKDSLMKLLLSSNNRPIAPTMERTSKGANKLDEDEDEDETFRLSSYLHRSCGIIAKTNVEEVGNDHSYVRPPISRLDFVFAKPLRTLFVHSPNDTTSTRDEEEEIDVETVPIALSPVYDTTKAVNMMEDCERHVNFQHPDEGNPNWEEHISKVNWTTMQSRLFHKVVRWLHSDRLARAAHSGRINEPILRRLTVDKTARRLRQTLASVAWNNKYTQWLHNTLMDNLPASYLISYLEALQTLKTKIPPLIDRLLAGSNVRSSLATPNHELLNIIHKRPWDPLSAGVSRHKLKKLPRDPILVMVPSGPNLGNSPHSRSHRWMANLSPLGTVVCVYPTPVAGRITSKTSVANCLDHMLASTRAKVTELQTDYVDKPVILVGIGSGATLACQVALVENVTAVVCLGFPLHTAEDSRGTPDDSLLNLQVPSLFVVGQDATTCMLGDLEDFRDKLNAVSSLVVVGGGDDQLRLTKSKKKLFGVTQALVDKCVVDEVADFLGTLLSPDYIPPSKPLPVVNIDPTPKRTMMKTIERKRKFDVMLPSNNDAPPPMPKRPGRKPKIPMMQKLIPNKWSNQPLTTAEVTRSPIVISSAPTTPSTLTQSVTVPVVTSKPVTLSPKPRASTHSEGTITVVAASSPTITAATAAKSRLNSGQLTSLSSILQPGTRGVISPSSRTGTSDEKLITISSTSAAPPILDELNILDMPVILGDQNPDDPLLQTQSSLQSQPKPSPVKFILTNTKPRGKQTLSTLKYLSPSVSQQQMKCTKIYISKAPDSADHGTVYLGEVGKATTTRAKPKIRHIPATKHSQFYKQ